MIERMMSTSVPARAPAQLPVSWMTASTDPWGWAAKRWTWTIVPAFSSTMLVAAPKKVVPSISVSKVYPSSPPFASASALRSATAFSGPKSPPRW